MADFRRCFLALAVLVLVIGAVAPASAQVVQAFNCSANAAVPPTLRQEGITELIGDIVLNCTGALQQPGGTFGPVPVGAAVPTANFTIFLGGPVTSRLLANGGLDAILFVDEPTPVQQKVCPSLSGAGTGSPCAAVGTDGASYATNGNYNVYQGTLTGSNAVTFLGIPIDPPTSPTSPARVYRISNIRTSGSAYPAITTGVAPVQGYISISGSTSVPITNATPVVGFVASSLTTSVGGAAGTGFLQCQSQNATPTGTLTFSENFATAFKTRDASQATYPTSCDPVNGCGGQGLPGNIWNTESGTIVSTTADDTPLASQVAPFFGLADFGTRLKATFVNIPAGASLSVDASATDSAGGTAVLVADSGAGESATDLPSFAGPTPLTPTPYTLSLTPYTSNGVTTYTAEAVWEVTAASSVAIDSFSFNVYLTYTAAPGTPGSPVGTPGSPATTGTPGPQVNLSYAPTVCEPNTTECASGGAFTLPTGATATTGPIPRFQGNNTYSNLFSISLCQTTLLFPYVTDYPGFDTGIAISNTSADPLSSLGLTPSASPQIGACSVTFYGGVSADDQSQPYTNTATYLGTAGTDQNGISVGVYSSTALSNGGKLFGTGLLGPGQTWAFAISEIDCRLATPACTAPTPFTGFIGYAIAQCAFQYAHGYGYVSDIGGVSPASYLPLVIPDTPRTATPFECSTFQFAPGVAFGCKPTGEQLVH